MTLKGPLGFTILPVLTGVGNFWVSPRSTTWSFLKMTPLSGASRSLVKPPSQWSLSRVNWHQRSRAWINLFAAYILLVRSHNPSGAKVGVVRTKNLERVVFPPTHAALILHIICTNFIAICNKPYPNTCPLVNQDAKEWGVAVTRTAFLVLHYANCYVGKCVIHVFKNDVKVNENEDDE